MSDRVVAMLLAIFFGWCGIHKFYCHRVFQGILYFIFCETGIPWLFAIVDAIRSYEFHLLNPDNGHRVVAIESGDTYTEALEKIHDRYGAAWIVESGNLITVNA